MAVKFSEFIQKNDATSSSVTEIVGYLSTGQQNVRLNPSFVDTTYSFSTTNGSSPALTLAGTKTGVSISDTLVTLSALNAPALTGSGTNAISIDSTAYALSATDNADPAQNTPVVLTGTGGGDSGTDTVNIIGSGTVGVTSSSGTITITGSGGGGDTYSINATQDGSNVDLNLDAASGTDSTVQLTAGSNITLTRNSANEVTIASSGGGGGGGVTSVGITETGDALTITNSPITSSGAINIAGAGTSSQVILGDLTLAALPTDTNTTYDLAVPAATTNINLAGSDGTNDPVTITGGTVLGAVHTSTSEITLNHDSVTRSDTTSSDSPAAGGTVDLVKTITTSTEGHVTAVDISTVTFPTAGGFGSINQFTGTGSALGALTLGSTPTAAQNCMVSISGVTQNYFQSDGTTPNWTVSTNTLTFAFSPPVTAAKGIQIIVIN